MSEQEILDNAPEGWTHYDGQDYFKISNATVLDYIFLDVWCSDSKKWIEWIPVENLRSRKDIELIVELEQECELLTHENTDKDRRIAELERERDMYKSAIDEECVLWDFTVDENNPRKSIQRLLDIVDVVARDIDVNKKARSFAIEQQAKGIEDALKNSPSRFKHSLPLVDMTELFDYAEQLRNQAKGGAE